MLKAPGFKPPAPFRIVSQSLKNPKTAVLLLRAAPTATVPKPSTAHGNVMTASWKPMAAALKNPARFRPAPETIFIPVLPAVRKAAAWVMNPAPRSMPTVQPDKQSISVPAPLIWKTAVGLTALSANRQRSVSVRNA